MLPPRECLGFAARRDLRLQVDSDAAEDGTELAKFIKDANGEEL